MSKSEKKADNAKKAAGTKAGKQYVPATKKGKVKKSDRLESLEKIIREEIDAVLDEKKKKKKKPCKPSKGKRIRKKSRRQVPFIRTSWKSQRWRR